MGRSRAQQQAKFNKRVDDAKNDLNAGTIKNIREAAEVHGIAYSSLRDRLAGAKNRQEAHVEQQNLTPVEENAIKKWILKLDDWGFPPKHQYVKDMACDFLRSHGIRKPKLGKNWITRFLNRHPDLASKFCTRLDKQRSYASNLRISADFFVKVRS
jgi:hypothetical protein